MKILVSCYACSPYKGSEPGMGWNFVRALSQHHELHIITEGKFEKDIRQFFQEHPESKTNTHFYFIWKNRHKKLRKIWPPSYYWFYKEWQKKAYKLAGELDKKEHFDVIHQLNMVGFREPGYLWKMEHKPFVWGPIGGFNITPWKMLPSMGLYGILFYGCRNLINLWQMHSMRRVRKAAIHSNALISATQECHDRVKKLYGRESVIIPEVGLLNINNVTPLKRKDAEPLRICWSGQHTAGKSLNLLLDAMNLLKEENIELHVIGEGNQTKKWKKKAKKYGLTNIIWHGWVERSMALSIMQSCHLFIITSMCDLTSTVILEALSYALPIIAMDHCGFSNVITPECGIKIPVTNPTRVAQELSDAIALIAKNEEMRFNMSKGALAHAKDFEWEQKGQDISDIYNNVSNGARL